MDWFLANSGMVFERAGQHLVLALVPMVLGLLISIPLAQVSRRHPVLRSVVTSVIPRRCRVGARASKSWPQSRFESAR